MVDKEITEWLHSLTTIYADEGGLHIISWEKSKISLYICTLNVIGLGVSFCVHDFN